MSIAINPGTAFDIETYDGLLAYVTEHLELDADTVTQLPTMLRLAEARIDRLCMTPERETSISVATVGGEQVLQVPTDYRHFTNARLVSAQGYALELVTLGFLHDQYTNCSGAPVVYALSNGTILLGPVPDAAYTLSFSYLSKLDNLSSTNQTNWLLSENPDVYKYALLFQVSTWLEDLAAAEGYRAEMMTIIDEINLQAMRYRRSRGMRLRSPVVV